MTDAQARADIALIRAALEQGRAYVTARGPDMIVWGCLIAAGYLGTWAFLAGDLPVRPGLLWPGILAIGWLFYVQRRLPGRAPQPHRPLVRSLRMLWLGIGISLTHTLTAVVGNLRGNMGLGWFDPFAAGILGAGFFASAPLCNLPWLRWVAGAWWLGELVVFWLQGSVTALPVAAGLYLLLLAGAGLVLRLRRQPA
jgi:hypothetical protein